MHKYVKGESAHGFIMLGVHVRVLTLINSCHFNVNFG